jgi:hypothetical protein
MIIQREPLNMSYANTIKKLQDAAAILDEVTGHFPSSFISRGVGYLSYYPKEYNTSIVTHFSGVPCFKVSEFNTSHIVLCVTPEGTCFHPMGQCPERLPLLEPNAEPDAELIGGEWQ